MCLIDLDVIVISFFVSGWGGCYWILVKLCIDIGFVGWGECYVVLVGFEVMIYVICDVFEWYM